MTTRIGLNHIDIVGPLGFVIPFTAYFSLLSARAVFQRIHSKISLGDEEGSASESEPEKNPTATKATSTGSDNNGDKHHHHHPHGHHRHGHHPLFVLARAHINFAENVPLALLFATVVELNGGSKQMLTLSLGGLPAARVMRVEFGLCRPGGTGMGRAVGYYGTMGVMSFLAGYAGGLVKDYWFAR